MIPLLPIQGPAYILLSLKAWSTCWPVSLRRELRPYMQGRGASVHALQRSAVHERTVENMVTCARSWTGRELLCFSCYFDRTGRPAVRAHERRQSACACPTAQSSKQSRRRVGTGRGAAARALGAVTLCSLGSRERSRTVVGTRVSGGVCG